ncbi:SRPBCC family protein [Roseovarius sp. 2305UL8-3]|uniref:SRPBCC family protein n=1 Tax=Roseovarius conchicola TaxID=3121636 RepID=UPI003526E69A
MKFSAKEDIEAPIEFVFEQVTDFTAFERSALRRGAEVQRIDSLTEPGPGMAWDASFKLRGRKRDVKIELTSIDAPNGLVVSSRSPAMGGELVVDLVALSRGRTRMSVDIEMSPKNLSARLLVQSLKLARNNLNKRFRKRVAGHAEEIEDRYKKVG